LGKEIYRKGLLKMLNIEQYNNLSNHIKYVNNNVQTIMTKEPVVADGEFLDLIIDAKEHLDELQDIINFLVEGNGVR
jgi:hypothetical protein